MNWNINGNIWRFPKLEEYLMNEIPEKNTDGSISKIKIECTLKLSHKILYYNNYHVCKTVFICLKIFYWCTSAPRKMAGT